MAGEMADYQITVQIEHRQYVGFLRLEREASGSIDLTTIEQGQQRAEVQVFATAPGNRHALTSFHVTHIPRPAGRKALLTLTGKVERGRLRLQLHVERKLFEEKVVDVRKLLPRRRMTPYLIAAALLILLGAGGYILFSSLSPGGNTAGVSVTRTPPETGTAGTGKTQSGGAQTPAALPGEPAGTPQGARTQESPEDNGASGAAVPPAVPAVSGTEEPPSPAAAQPQEKTWTVYFLPDSAMLTRQARQELGQIYAALKDLDVSQVEIVGHCALAGTEAGREEVSWERARTVRAFLENLGYRFPQKTEVRGVGGSEPVTRDAGLQYLNRRVVISVGG